MTTTTRDRRPNGGTPNAGAIVTDFLTAFHVGNLDHAKSLVRGDFSFRAPLIKTSATKDAYFAGADEKARFLRSFRVLHQWEDGNEVSTVYELDIETTAGAATMLIHEWFTVHDGQIASAVMMFDTAARATQLLGNALGSGHHQ